MTLGLSVERKTPGLSETKPGHFTVGELNRWLKAEWAGKFDDLASNNLVGAPSASLKMGAGPPLVAVLPGTIEECHTEILLLQTAMDDLKPDALQFRSDHAKHKRDGRKGGRGKSK